MGRYEIVRLLRDGPRDTLYLARDTRLGRPVRLTVLPGDAADADAGERTREALRAAARLEHPHVLPLYDWGEEDGRPFFVTAHVEGESLRDRLRLAEALPVEEALEIVGHIGAALAFAHDHEVAHGAVDPEHVTLTPRGALLEGFGVGAATGEIETEEADLRALGVLLHTMLGSADISPALERTVVRARAREPAERFTSVGSFLDALDEVRESRPHTTRRDDSAGGLRGLWEEAKRRHVHHVATLYSAFALFAVELADATFPHLEMPGYAVRVVIAVAVAGLPIALLLAWIYEIRAESMRPGAIHPSSGSASSGLIRRRLRRGAFGAALAIPLLATTWLWARESSARTARTETLPEASRLIERGENHAAMRLLEEAEAHLPGDPLLEELWMEATTLVTIRSDPPGAEIRMRDFLGEPGNWQYLGRAPLEDVRAPTGYVVWKLTLEDHRDREVVALTASRDISFELQHESSAPPGMVHVPPGVSEFWGAPPVRLEAFWIDRHEVTNREFREFVAAGGYEREELWSDSVTSNGEHVPFPRVRTVFVDRTGRPGPSTWELGSYPAGQEDHPVTGVSWYEANAYCSAAGKNLPTLHHWYRAADLFTTTQIAHLGRFSASGTAPVGSHLRLGTFGTYDMVGNAKEWTLNPALENPDLRYILGGGWNEPSYAFGIPDAQRPSLREEAFGFRCARYIEPPSESASGPVPAPLRDYRDETPVGDEIFSVYRALYDYDPSLPLESEAEIVEELEHWRIERVEFDAAYGNERVPAFLFLPNDAAPPFQTVIYFPGAAAFFERPPFDTEELWGEWFLFLVRSGRAVLFPVYNGTFERHVGPPLQPQVWQDIIIGSVRDLRRAVDYLETRSDIDTGRLGYFGLSLGASVGPMMTALEPRIEASVLLGGGLVFWERSPETEVFNFLPRVQTPTLMINGRHDFAFPYETSQVPMYEWLGVPVEQKEHVVFESGHIPTERQEVIRRSLDWFDRHLGRVVHAYVAPEGGG